MKFFKKFVPSVFNSLTAEEKKEIIIKWSNYLMDNLETERIPVMFDSELEKDGQKVAGKHILAPCFIGLNDLFLKDINEIKENFDGAIDYEIYIPYYLLHTIAHECFHHYQYTLTQKLINDVPLSNQDKDQAYLYFICLYSDLFMSLNDKIHFSKLPEANRMDLYLYSPIEIQANLYGNKITDILGKIDDEKNYMYYQNIQFDEQLKFMKYNKLQGGNLTIKSIEYRLQLALDFLEYKNKTNGVKVKYLGIDQKELEESVKRTITTWKKKEIVQNKFLDKIFKK